MGERLILVTGGTGHVGSGVVIAFLKDGWKVITMSRSPDRIKKLLAIVPDELKDRLVIKQTGLTDFESAVKLREDIIEEYGVINHVVASFVTSEFSGNVLTERNFEEAEAVVVNTMRPHFLLQKAFLSYLNQRKGTTYVTISDLSSEELYPPVMGTLPLAAAVIAGLSTAIRSQFKDENVAVSDIRIGMLIRMRNGEKHYYPIELPELDHEDLGGLVVAMVTTQYRALECFLTRDDFDAILKKVKKSS